MKFTEGLWKVKEKYQAEYAREIRDIKQNDDTLEMFCPYRNIDFRYNTLNIGQFTIKITSPLNDCISVKITGHKGNISRGFNYIWDCKKINTKITESGAEFVSGKLTLCAQKKPFNISFWAEEKRLTGYLDKSLSMMTNKNSQERYIVNGLELGVAENIYGLGERFTPFVRNGQSIDIWNEDGGTASNISYKNIPFYISSRGYGVFVNTTDRVSFEVGSEKVEETQFSVEDEELEYVLIYGPTPAEILEKYTALTGRPALPPPWSFGLWLSTSFTTDYDEKTVNYFIDEMIKRKIPLSAFHFDCFWMKEFEWCNFEWDNKLFPDPRGMLERLHKKDIKVCVWINPYIAQKSQLFDEGMEKGYFLKKIDGTVLQRDEWQAGMAIVDFSNPSAYSWFACKLEKLLDMGVDCFKTDFGERIPDNAVYFDNSNPRKAHNYYTYMYNRCVFELLERKKGIGEAVVFARSACAGSQLFPVHWGGDCSSNYNSMAESLRGGLSLATCGFGFWSHDIGGFENNSAPDVYKRWIAFGLLSSHSRLHGSTSYRVPWNYDEESSEVLRFFTQLKCSLMPYIFGAAVNAHTKGTPVIRPMFFEFGGHDCEHLDRQYMLGSSLLVAPVFNDQNTCDFYLPQGEWTHYLSGEKLTGGKWIKQTFDFFSLPLFVRPNSIIPKGAVNTRPDYDYIKDTVFEIFALNDKAQCTVYSSDTKTTASIDAQYVNGVITITTQGSVKNVLLNGIFEAEVTDGVKEKTPTGLKITLNSNKIKIKL